MAPGTPIPIEANPLEMMQVLGASAWYMRAIHILWAPTSLMTMSCAASTWRTSQTIFWGFRGKPASSACSESSSTMVWRRFEAGKDALGRAVAAIA